MKSNTLSVSMGVVFHSMRARVCVSQIQLSSLINVTSLSETSSLAVPGTCQFGWITWPVSPRDPPVAAKVMCMCICTDTPCFYWDLEDCIPTHILAQQSLCPLSCVLCPSHAFLTGHCDTCKGTTTAAHDPSFMVPPEPVCCLQCDTAGVFEWPFLWIPVSVPCHPLGFLNGDRKKTIVQRQRNCRKEY